jgi:hypothetical protein
MKHHGRAYWRGTAGTLLSSSAIVLLDDAEVVACAAVNADSDSDHGRHGDSRVIVGLLTTSRIA